MSRATDRSTRLRMFAWKFLARGGEPPYPKHNLDFAWCCLCSSTFSKRTVVNHAEHHLGPLYQRKAEQIEAMLALGCTRFDIAAQVWPPSEGLP